MYWRWVGERQKNLLEEIETDWLGHCEEIVTLKNAVAGTIEGYKGRWRRLIQVLGNIKQDKSYVKEDIKRTQDWDDWRWRGVCRVLAL